MRHKDLFSKIISSENLFRSWDEFKVGKNKKPDVMKFEKFVERNIFRLQRELGDSSYRHGPYSSFYICDPKLRHIHKATVRDSVLHHAIFNILNPVFEPSFINTSFSCRIGKGNHKGVEILRDTLRRVSQNNTKPCYALKCDIRRFFDSVDHSILFSIFKRKIRDRDAMNLIREVVDGFQSETAIIERERERVINNQREYQ